MQENRSNCAWNWFFPSSIYLSLTHLYLIFLPNSAFTRPSSWLFISCSISMTDSIVWQGCFIWSMHFSVSVEQAPPCELSVSLKSFSKISRSGLFLNNLSLWTILAASTWIVEMEEEVYCVLFQSISVSDLSSHLMKDRKMCRIDFISSIDVAKDEKIVKSRSQQVDLVSCAVSSEQMVSIYIITVRLRSARMIFGNQQGVKVLLHRDDWIDVVVHTEHRISSWIPISSIEILDNSLTKHREWMMLLQMNISAKITRNFRRDVGVIVRDVLVIV